MITRSVFFSLLVLSAQQFQMHAQIMSGSIAGIVVDSSGSIVGEATLTLLHVSTGVSRRLATDATGNFLFNGVDGGEYTLRIEKPGFKAMERKAINLPTGDRISLGHIALDLGAVSETVSVTSSA
jgi:hypothetical protein